MIESVCGDEVSEGGEIEDRAVERMSLIKISGCDMGEGRNQNWRG